MTEQTAKRPKRVRDPIKMRAYRAKWRLNNQAKNKACYTASRKRKIATEPWYKLFISLTSRCYSKSHHYYKKGIKCFLAPEDIKMIWFRDKAEQMSKPSLDRIDDKAHYTLENVHIIELSENLEKRWAKMRNGTGGIRYGHMTCKN